MIKIIRTIFFSYLLLTHSLKGQTSQEGLSNLNKHNFIAIKELNQKPSNSILLTSNKASGANLTYWAVCIQDLSNEQKGFSLSSVDYQIIDDPEAGPIKLIGSPVVWKDSIVHNLDMAALMWPPTVNSKQNGGRQLFFIDDQDKGHPGQVMRLPVVEKNEDPSSLPKFDPSKKVALNLTFKNKPVVATKLTCSVYPGDYNEKNPYRLYVLQGEGQKQYNSGTLFCFDLNDAYLPTNPTQSIVDNIVCFAMLDYNTLVYLNDQGKLYWTTREELFGAQGKTEKHRLLGKINKMLNDNTNQQVKLTTLEGQIVVVIDGDGQLHTCNIGANQPLAPVDLGITFQDLKGSSGPNLIALIPNDTKPKTAYIHHNQVNNLVTPTIPDLPGFKLLANNPIRQITICKSLSNKYFYDACVDDRYLTLIENQQKTGFVPQSRWGNGAPEVACWVDSCIFDQTYPIQTFIATANPVEKKLYLYSSNSARDDGKAFTGSQWNQIFKDESKNYKYVHQIGLSAGSKGHHRIFALYQTTGDEPHLVCYPLTKDEKEPAKLAPIPSQAIHFILPVKTMATLEDGALAYIDNNGIIQLANFDYLSTVGTGKTAGIHSTIQTLPGQQGLKFTHLAAKGHLAASGIPANLRLAAIDDAGKLYLSQDAGALRAIDFGKNNAINFASVALEADGRLAVISKICADRGSAKTYGAVQGYCYSSDFFDAMCESGLPVATPSIIDANNQLEKNM